MNRVQYDLHEEKGWGIEWQLDSVYCGYSTAVKNEVNLQALKFLERTY